MHVLEYLHRNVKTVAMPSAMVAGALLCRPVTALEAWTHQMITPSLIFLMLFVTFCRVKPSQMKPSMLHVWLLLFQVVVSAALYFALLPLDAIVAQGAMICVLAPVAMAAVVIAGMLGANVPTMATYSLLCNMAIALIAPVVLSLAGTGACSFTQILARIAPLLIMPFAAAQFCRFLLPKTAKWIGDHSQISFYMWPPLRGRAGGRAVARPEEHGAGRMDGAVVPRPHLLDRPDGLYRVAELRQFLSDLSPRSAEVGLSAFGVGLFFRLQSSRKIGQPRFRVAAVLCVCEAVTGRGLFPEDEIDGQNQAEESGEVVPAQGVGFHEDQCKEREYGKRYDLLYHFKFPDGERAAELRGADAVGGDLKAVFEQGDAPAQQDDRQHAEAFEFRFECDMPVPCERHEGVRYDEQNDGGDSFEHICVRVKNPANVSKISVRYPLRGNICVGRPNPESGRSRGKVMLRRLQRGREGQEAGRFLGSGF